MYEEIEVACTVAFRVAVLFVIKDACSAKNEFIQLIPAIRSVRVNKEMHCRYARTNSSTCWYSWPNYYMSK